MVGRDHATGRQGEVPPEERGRVPQEALLDVLLLPGAKGGHVRAVAPGPGDPEQGQVAQPAAGGGQGAGQQHGGAHRHSELGGRR